MVGVAVGTQSAMSFFFKQYRKGRDRRVRSRNFVALCVYVEKTTFLR